MTAAALAGGWPDVAAPGGGIPAPAGGVLLAVDGNSLAHRAYHALESTGMTDPAGGPIWAVHGFMRLLVGVLERIGPDAVVVGFDCPHGSTRRERFPGYKAGRAEHPDALRSQLAAIPVLLDDLGVTVVSPAGLEADDVVASAAAVAEGAGWSCVVVTSDKDSFGLISERTSVLRLVSGLANAQLMTPAALVEAYGVGPGQWRDYVVLVGDKSDNLPGVDRIGPKTAVKLLAACGSLDAALADPQAAVAAIRKSGAGLLVADGAAEAIARNRDLMEPVTTVPVDLDACGRRPDPDRVAGVLRRWHLPSHVDQAVVALCPRRTTAGEPDPVERPALPDGARSCRHTACRAPIRTVTTVGGAGLDVDAVPDPCGTLGWARTGQGWRMQPLADGQEPERGQRWMPHYRTCQGPESARRPPRHLEVVADPPGLPTAEQAAAVLAGQGLDVDQAAGPSPVLERASAPPGRPVRAETRPCCMGHPDKRPTRLYAGGVFCDDCAPRPRTRHQETDSQ